ncbi:MAG: hypothetical protein J1F39_07355 [Clostridiales bacterium]|nr:hypothetical protein [Clostridiales bacterium]
MDNDRHRSSEIPVDVTVESDLEPVVFCAGRYSEEPNGFTLNFSFGDGVYTFTRKNGVSVFSSFGFLSYTVNLSSRSEVDIDSAYGKMKLVSSPVLDEVEEYDGGVKINLEYVITGGGEDMRRKLKIDARFIRGVV